MALMIACASSIISEKEPMLSGTERIFFTSSCARASSRFRFFISSLRYSSWISSISSARCWRLSFKKRSEEAAAELRGRAVRVRGGATSRGGPRNNVGGVKGLGGAREGRTHVEGADADAPLSGASESIVARDSRAVALDL